MDPLTSDKFSIPAIKCISLLGMPALLVHCLISAGIIDSVTTFLNVFLVGLYVQ